jgi:hypothetical protein
MTRHATISTCARYRYTLSRSWDQSLPTVTFIGLNPSTADAMIDDPTIRRCVGFAKTCGCGQLTMVNLFAWRSTAPRNLAWVSDPVGPENDTHLLEAAANATTIVAAWGSHGGRLDRDKTVLALLARAPIRVQCLGLTQHGLPRHPLYIKAGTRLIEFGDAPSPDQAPRRMKHLYCFGKTGQK